MSKKFFIHAPGIHQGGGAVLLNSLLKALDQKNPNCLHADARMSFAADIPCDEIHSIKPTLLHRFLAEWRLYKKVKPQDTVICFANLPPLFPIKAELWVFLQNRYLIDENTPLNDFNFKTKLRISIERIWLNLTCSRVKQFIVQSPTMARLLKAKYGEAVPVKIMPFVSTLPTDNIEKLTSRKYQFIYVASGEPHKNHQTLIEAWCLLAKENIRPSLALTLDSKCTKFLYDWAMVKKQEFNLEIDNFEGLNHEEIAKLYNQTAALIYPSLFESYGLPLLEAKQRGLALLTSELDYVRDAVIPDHTFDAHSAVSIARAVKRFLKIADEPSAPVDAKTFLSELNHY
jgi:glycosyltransferase involved in cell wall biosynthesis